MSGDRDIRREVLDTTLALLLEGGRDAVTTRAVTSAVHIQAPTLYRLFGDKHGLLDAAAAHGFATHLGTWQGWEPGADPVEAIRQGWDMHVQWGLANPTLYSIAYGDARPGTTSAAAEAIDAILRTLVEQAALAGRLALPVEEAVSMLRAVGAGVVLTLIAMPEGARDPKLSTRGREAVLSTILVGADGPPSTRDDSGAAMQLKAGLPQATVLSTNERALLGDWLDRLAGR